MEMVYFRLLYLKQTIYELKGDAELPIHNVNLKNIQVGEVKKYIRSSINVSEVTEDNISIEKNINQK